MAIKNKDEANELIETLFEYKGARDRAFVMVDRADLLTIMLKFEKIASSRKYSKKKVKKLLKIQRELCAARVLAWEDDKKIILDAKLDINATS